MEKPSFFIMDIEASYEVLLWEIHFISFFLNERNITISLMMMYLKFNVVQYANLNSNSINKPCLRAIEYVFSDFLFISYLCLF